jgi:hypothetical protein
VSTCVMQRRCSSSHSAEVDRKALPSTTRTRRSLERAPLRYFCFSAMELRPLYGIRGVTLCWLFGTSILKIDDFALDLLMFLRAVACTDEGMQAHCVCLHPSCRRIRCSSSPAVGDERAEVSFRLCWLLGSSIQKSGIFGGMISLSDQTSL